METFLAIFGGILGLIFSVAVFSWFFAILAVMITGVIGLATKDYKYFKVSLKIMGYILAAFAVSVLLFAVKIFVEKVLLG